MDFRSQHLFLIAQFNVIFDNLGEETKGGTGPLIIGYFQRNLTYREHLVPGSCLNKIRWFACEHVLHPQFNIKKTIKITTKSNLSIITTIHRARCTVYCAVCTEKGGVACMVRHRKTYLCLLFGCNMGLADWVWFRGHSKSSLSVFLHYCFWIIFMCL